MADQLGSPEVAISAREAEVLAAVGEHLTNAEIGTRLFISVRTVESHVSALLRKLQVDDRRALAAAAGQAREERAAEPARTSAALPSPLTPFVGRSAERAALSAALHEHRLVTAVGPGGVGKTRLALTVAADVSDRYADGVWYVDLVPVTDPVMIGPAIADALGLSEHPGRSVVDTLVSWLADRETLLVLDNCEHLLDGVVVLVERLLAASRRSAILATSRARLLVPFEWVFLVPGLSVEAADGSPGDAVELFRGRAAAGGRTVPARDVEQVAVVCRALDGMALAIELAAARYPSLGVDGLEAGLGDRLRMLSGGPRVDDRHRSLRSTLDWSYALLDAPSQAVLQRICVFAEPFTATAAEAVVADWPPVPSADLVTILAGLADQSLLIAAAGAGGTRYRALETIRQYGDQRLSEAGESVPARTRHLSWCRQAAAALEVAARATVDGWRSTFDEVADELRAALTWAAGEPSRRSDAHRLALGLADLAFARGLLGESQRRYEQAAELADDNRAVAAALRSAAGAAESRHFGDESQRLRRAAADVAVRAGDQAGAAADLARVAERINRGPGLMSTPPEPGDADRLLEQGWALADGDSSARARLLIAEAFNGPETDPVILERTNEALVLARRLADPQAESAALDQLTAIQLAHGETRAAAASALRRTELLAPMPVTAMTGFEIFDSLVMAAECAIAAGDLPGARRLACRLRDLPFYREEGHLATSRLIVVTVLAGDWSEAVRLAERFRAGWERAGRPRAGNLSRGAYAAATVHGLRGDDEARAAWLDIVAGLATPRRPISTVHFGEFFDALLFLHRGQPERAAQLMTTPPEQFTQWYSGLWRPWYAALWAEAAVLTNAADAADHIARARVAAAGNRIARRARRSCGRRAHAGRRPRRIDRRGRRSSAGRLSLPVGADSGAARW